MINTKPEQLRQATLSDDRVLGRIEHCRSSFDYPHLAGTFLNHVQLKKTPLT
jgi:hypothetical protein